MAIENDSCKVFLVSTQSENLRYLCTMGYSLLKLNGVNYLRYHCDV